MRISVVKRILFYLNDCQTVGCLHTQTTLVHLDHLSLIMNDTAEFTLAA